MDWVGQAAGWLRGVLAQRWLDAWQTTIAHTPDWAVLATAAAMPLLFVLVLRLTWPRSRASQARNHTRTKPPPAQKESRQTKPAKLRIEAALAPKAVPPVSTPSPKPVVARTAAAPAQAPTTTPDDEDNRSVRVFVSSTFLDMQTERNELVTKAFPALRAKYRARGVEVFEVDLRWGITPKMQDRGETLPTLLAEIDRCRPYFIGLLGDRYGWVPPAETLTDKLKADYPAIAKAEGASVTAMEIIHGVLSSPDALKRAMFFERDPSWDWMTTLNDADRAAAKAETAAEREKLAELKTQIRQQASVETYARPEDIRQKVTDALDALLEARFPEARAPDAFEQTARLHRAYARERRGLHVGAEGYLAELNRWMDTKGAAPMLITGASGGGKSALVANWLHTWRSAHTERRAFVFEHYLGASPDSADPMLIMRRLWEHLNRATGETVDLPDAEADLMDVSAGLVERLAHARATTDRSGAQILIALDGLDKLSSEQNLRWLPTVPGVHLLASSLDGEAKSSGLARGFASLDVKPLTEKERQDFIAGTLARWRRELEPQYIARILTPTAAELAGSPLYLKTVLEELRVSADNAHLSQRLEDYLRARDMANLFDRVLARLEEDCEPGLVAKTLPLIWASRAGLEEAEIIAITGATPLAWATLRNGLGDGLRDQAGRLAFSHDYLNQAVAARYLAADDKKRAAHLAIADQFDKRDPDLRQAEELPFQLRAAEAWDRLEALLVDLDRFELLRARSDGELWGYWRPLKEHRGHDPEALLCGKFEARSGKAIRWSQENLDTAFALTDFLFFTRAVGPARIRLGEYIVDACEHLFGAEHGRTARALHDLGTLLLTLDRFAEAEALLRRALAISEATDEDEYEVVPNRLNSLASVLEKMGRHVEAEALFRRALDLYEENVGPNDLELVTVLGNLASLLRERDRVVEAEALYRRAVAIKEASLGPDHPSLATSLSNLGSLLADTGRSAEGEQLTMRALAIDEKFFGPEHSGVAPTLNNLALLLHEAGRTAEAEPLMRRALDIYEKTFGAEHSLVAGSLGNLAGLLDGLGRYDEAEPIFRRALAIDEASLGPEHTKVATDLNNLALLLSATERNAEAEPLFRRALAIDEASLGPEHTKVATDLNNLALLLSATERNAEAEPLFRRALAIDEASLGPEHSKVATDLYNLARLLSATERNAEAEPILRRALAIAISNRNRVAPFAASSCTR